jgi:hypothetical protein
VIADVKAFKGIKLPARTMTDLSYQTLISAVCDSHRKHYPLGSTENPQWRRDASDVRENFRKWMRQPLRQMQIPNQHVSDSIMPACVPAYLGYLRDYVQINLEFPGKPSTVVRSEIVERVSKHTAWLRDQDQPNTCKSGYPTPRGHCCFYDWLLDDKECMRRCNGVRPVIEKPVTFFEDGGRPCLENLDCDSLYAHKWGSYVVCVGHDRIGSTINPPNNRLILKDDQYTGHVTASFGNAAGAAPADEVHVERS